VESEQRSSVSRILLFVAVAVGIGFFVTVSIREKPRLISVKAPEKRVVMPGFKWPSVDGPAWSLAEHRGKIVVVNFWATWCGPCREEIPDLVRVYEQYSGRDVVFAGISLDSKPSEVVPSFARRYKIPYPTLVPAPESAIANAIQTIPTSFLIDRQGRIARTWAGVLQEPELTKNIEELLAEKAP
jgi:cytochrome c biogenesis protein CcmG, thiol:disulfide interchange protein DsbE